ncbi:MAG: dodecin family protein [Acidiferrobacterales bacterium]
MSVYKVIELVGTSSESWEDAAKSALGTAAKSLKDLRVAEVSKLDVALDDKGNVSRFRVKLDVSFKIRK